MHQICEENPQRLEIKWGQMYQIFEKTPKKLEIKLDKCTGMEPSLQHQLD